MPNYDKKQLYFDKLIKLVKNYDKVVIVTADNVGSNHMQRIRANLRKVPGDNIILMGKNTMIRKAIKGHLKEIPQLEALLPHVKGNIGFVFTHGDLNRIREEIKNNIVQAPAKIGSISPVDVIVPKGPTGLDPQQTSFMQALNIATKINRGQVEISYDVHLLKPGDKVDSSKATLLTKLGIKPFSYGLKIKSIYDDGSVFEPSVLDIQSDDLISRFLMAVQLVAALSLGSGQPSIAAVPHYLANAYKDLLAISVATDYTFEGAKKIKEYLADPEAFAASFAAAAPAASAVTTTTATSAAAAPVEEEKEKEEEKDEEKEDEDDALGDLFGFGDE